jgi:Fe-S oxidoreductase
VRFKQLRATGADTVVTACPFCSIMLKGAHASAGAQGGDVQFVDLMTFVNDRLNHT